MDPVKTLSTAMKKAAELEIAQPDITIPELAEAVNKSYNTIVNWRGSKCYLDYITERLHEEVGLYATKAISMMKDMAEDGNFNAVKYLCDAGGFNAPNKVELATSNDIRINITND